MMGTIAEKLALLQETKENIRQAITNMGGTVPEGEVFAAYPDLRRSREALHRRWAVTTSPARFR